MGISALSSYFLIYPAFEFDMVQLSENDYGIYTLHIYVALTFYG